jgi:Plasmid pRiA4b ORF-3-like protein/Domain of unknown function (DUF1841)
MSPVSRGRKKKPRAQSGKPRGVRGTVAPLPVDGAYQELLRAFRPMVKVTDPLEVEMVASGLLGSWWKGLPPGEDPDRLFGEGAIGYAARQGGREAMALLRAFQAVGVTVGQREAAAAAASEVAARGVAEPPWAAVIGRVRVGACWRMADVYGDQASLLCVFGYGSREHGLLALLDFNHLGGWVKDVFLTDQPARALRELRRDVARDPIAVLDQLEPAEARRLLEAGFDATEMTWQPEVGEDFREYRALALARCRALPEPAEPAAEPMEVPEGLREALVAEFLASPQARALPDDEATPFCVRLIVDHGCDYDDGKPLRVSPAKTEIFVHDWVPRKAVLDDRDREVMPAVVRAWVRWAAERNRLPDEAVAEVVEAADECAGHFAEAYDEPGAASPIRLYLQGLEPGAGLEAAQDAVDRRMFTMPYFGTRIGDEDYPSLDPSDPDERRLLIEGEHPEYHDALDDPSFDGEVDGANPRLHLAIHEVVANQLWDDDPPEAWEAAKRLRAGGEDRHEILHRLGALVVEHLHGALMGAQGGDVAAYQRALAALGTRDGQRSPAAGRAQDRDAVYQIKVSLRSIRPPIWRRLRLPAGTSLGELHGVLQVAFGWDDDHLHAFEVGKRRFGPQGRGLERVGDERGARLREAAPAAGSRLRYIYDFGDSWEHDIVVEKILPPDGVPHAVCVGGRRAAPPEDCGGVWGYAALCEILADPAHPEHAERLAWLGHPYDAAAFDKAAINDALAAIRLRFRA